MDHVKFTLEPPNKLDRHIHGSCEEPVASLTQVVIRGAFGMPI